MMLADEAARVRILHGDISEFLQLRTMRGEADCSISYHFPFLLATVDVTSRLTGAP